jgi:hypothetical protein
MLEFLLQTNFRIQAASSKASAGLETFGHYYLAARQASQNILGKAS